jgi:hypothetical protein
LSLCTAVQIKTSVTARSMVDANSAVSTSIPTSSGASVGMTTEVRAQFRVVFRVISAGVRHQGEELVDALFRLCPDHKQSRLCSTGV